MYNSFCSSGNEKGMGPECQWPLEDHSDKTVTGLKSAEAIPRGDCLASLMTFVLSQLNPLSIESSGGSRPCYLSLLWSWTQVSQFFSKYISRA